MASNSKLSLPASLQRRTATDMAQVAEKASLSAAEEAKTIDVADFRVDAPNPEAEMRASRLKQAVQQAGGNNAVSTKSGVPTSTLGVYLRGGEWKVSAAIALAEACGVSLEWLVTGRSASDVAPPSLPVQANDRYVMIPRYDVQASAGSGTQVDQEEMMGLVSFDELFLRRQLGVRPDNLVTLEATGDSMVPTIRDGDLLLVDTANNEIQDGRIYVLSISGFLSVKRLQITMGGEIAVISDNERYPAQIITPSERDPLRIIGRVVYQAGPVRS